MFSGSEDMAAAGRQQFSSLLMADVIASPRFPHIGVQVFSYLNGYSLTNCRLVCREWMQFIDAECDKTLYERFVRQPGFSVHKAARRNWVYVFKIMKGREGD